MHFLLIAILFILIASLAYAYDNGMKGALPPRGLSTWCEHDACGLRDHCSEFGIKRRIRELERSGMLELGYDWYLLDDCWADHERDENDRLQPDAKRFPNGMPALVEYAHEHGVKLGLYTCIGTQTCKKNRPGSYGHYDIDAQTFAEWNVDMVKSDNCHKPSGEDDEALFREFSQELNATGHEMVFAICNWGEANVIEWGAEVAQMYRVQMDHLPFYSWPDTAAGEGYGAGVKNIIEYMADLNPHERQVQHGWMDPDFLETLFPVSMDETVSRTEFSFWAFWSSPMLLATEILNMSEDKKAILFNKEVLDVQYDPLFDGGRLIQTFEQNEAQIWLKELSTGEKVVMLFNPSRKHTSRIGVTWDMVGWNNGDKVKVRDLWSKEDELSVFGYASNVAPTAVTMIKLTNLS